VTYSLEQRWKREKADRSREEIEETRKSLRRTERPKALGRVAELVGAIRGATLETRQAGGAAGHLEHGAWDGVAELTVHQDGVLQVVERGGGAGGALVPKGAGVWG